MYGYSAIYIVIMASTTTKEYSGIESVLGLRHVLGMFPIVLPRMAHREISAATSLEDLGFSTKARVMRYVKRIWGVKKVPCWNSKNRTLALEIYWFDEGVFCHLLNKVSKWIREGVVPMGDYLGIYDDERDDLCSVFETCYDDVVFIESDQMFWALKGYVHAVRGDSV
jgi:hypothetical protein